MAAWAQDYSTTSIVTSEYVWCPECSECNPQVMNNEVNYECLLSHEVMYIVCLHSSSYHELFKVCISSDIKCHDKVKLPCHK